MSTVGKTKHHRLAHRFRSPAPCLRTWPAGRRWQRHRRRAGKPGQRQAVPPATSYSRATRTLII